MNDDIQNQNRRVKYHFIRIIDKAASALKDLENGKGENLKSYLGSIRADSCAVEEYLDGKRDKYGRLPRRVKIPKLKLTK
jgi:hypothetical protein